MDKNIKLDECKHLENSEYIKLKDPDFVGQTRADSEGNYWMVFNSEGVNYKFLHNINN